MPRQPGFLTAFGLRLAMLATALGAPAAHSQQATITRVDLVASDGTWSCSVTNPSNPQCNPSGVDGGPQPSISTGEGLIANVYFNVSGLAANSRLSAAFDIASPGFPAAGTAQQALATGALDGYGRPAVRQFSPPLVGAPGAASEALAGSAAGIPLASVPALLAPTACNGNQPLVWHLPVQIDLCGGSGSSCASYSTLEAGPGSLDHIDIALTNQEPAVVNTIAPRAAELSDAGFEITYLVSSDTSSCSPMQGCSYIPGDILSTLTSSYSVRQPDGSLSAGGAGTLTSVQWASDVDARYALFGPAAQSGFNAADAGVDGANWSSLPLVATSQVNSTISGGAYLAYTNGGTSVGFAAHHLEWSAQQGPLYFATFHYPANASVVSASESTSFSNPDEASCPAPGAPAAALTLDLEQTSIELQKQHGALDSATGFSQSYDNPDAGAHDDPAASTTPAQAMPGSVWFAPAAGAAVINPVLSDLLPAGVELAAFNGINAISSACGGLLGDASCADLQGWSVTAYTKGYVTSGSPAEIVCGLSGAGDTSPDPGTAYRSVDTSYLLPGDHFTCITARYDGLWVQGPIAFFYLMRMQEPSEATPVFQATNLAQLHLDNLSDAGVPVANSTAGATPLAQDTLLWEHREGVLPGCRAGVPGGHSLYGTAAAATLPADGSLSATFAIDPLRGTDSSGGQSNNPIENSIFDGYNNPTILFTLPPQLRLIQAPEYLGTDSNGNAVSGGCSAVTADGGASGTTYSCAAAGHFDAPAQMLADGGPSPLQIQFTASAVGGANGTQLSIPLRAWSAAYAGPYGTLQPYYSAAQPYTAATELVAGVASSDTSCSVTISGDEQLTLSKSAASDLPDGGELGPLSGSVPSNSLFAYDLILASGPAATAGTEGVLAALMPQLASAALLSGGAADAGGGELYYLLDGGNPALDGGSWISAAQISDLSQVIGVELRVRSPITGVAGEFNPLDAPLDLRLQMRAPAVASPMQLCNAAALFSNGAQEEAATAPTLVQIEPSLSLANPCAALDGGACVTAELQPLAIQLVGADSAPASDSFTYHCANLPSDALLDSISGEIDWTPPLGSSASSPFVAHCWITDQNGLHDDDGNDIGGDQCTGDNDDGSGHCGKNIKLAATRTDVAPVFAALGTQSVAEGQTLSFEVTASDPNCDLFSLSIAAPLGVVCAPLAARQTSALACSSIQTLSCSWTPGYTKAGHWTALATAREAANTPGGPLTSTQLIDIEVANVDRAPELDPLGPLVLTEEQTLSVEVTAHDDDIPLTGYLGLNGTQPYGDSLSLTALTLPAGAEFEPDTQILSWTPALGQWGDVDVPMQVTDHDGPLSDVELVHIHVQYENIAPLVSPTPAQNAQEGTPFSFSISALDLRSNLDVCRMSALPAGATFDPVARQFRWTPGAGAADASPYQLETTCCSVPPAGADPQPAQACSTVTTQVDVTTTLDISPQGPLTATTGKLFSFTVQGNNPTGEPSSCGLQTLPVGAAYDAATGIFQWTPAPDQTGAVPLQINCSDAEMSASETLVINVLPASSETTGGGLATSGCAQAGHAPNVATLPLLALAALLWRRRRAPARR